MKEMLPSQETLKMLFDYDLDGGLLWWKQRDASWFPTERAMAQWNGANAGKAAFTSLAAVGYLRGSLLGKQRYAHRVLWKIAYGTEPELIDHINQIKTDNRLSNLREATKSLNALNVTRHPGAGITKHRNGHKYYAKVGRHYLGLHKTEELAIAVRAEFLKEALK